MSRLLTPEEIDNIWFQSQGCPRKEEAMGLEIAKAQRDLTLKEVGEWLENNITTYTVEQLWQVLKLQKALKQGKMPEEVKG